MSKRNKDKEMWFDAGCLDENGLEKLGLRIITSHSGSHRAVRYVSNGSKYSVGTSFS